MSTHGKWSQQGVPHRGWRCVGVDDLGDPEAATCEMCESQSIRYAHMMEHDNYAEVLSVGCVCAEKMSGDYVNPKRREQALKSSAGRRRRWLDRAWRTSAQGNAFLNTDGFNITIFLQADGKWSGRILDRTTDDSVTARKVYPTENAAKLAAFDGMIFIKARGWPKPRGRH
jgi:hypothetical protein